MADSYDDLRNGVVLAELGGHGDGPYCAKHGAGAAMVLLGTYIVDPGDDVAYPAPFVFKPGRASYADYLVHHVDAARQSDGKVAASICCVALEDNVDFLQAAEAAGADYASYCAHSSMEMFISRDLSSRLCRRQHWGELRRLASALAAAVSIPVIFKIGADGPAEEVIGAVEVMAESGVPIIHANVWDTGAGSDGLAMVSDLKGKCEFLIAGGGIATAADARRVLDAGADAVAIGKAAMEDPGLIGRVQAALRA